jgi:hypothetical protein
MQSTCSGPMQSLQWSHATPRTAQTLRYAGRPSALIEYRRRFKWCRSASGAAPHRFRPRKAPSGVACAAVPRFTRSLAPAVLTLAFAFHRCVVGRRESPLRMPCAFVPPFGPRSRGNGCHSARFSMMHSRRFIMAQLASLPAGRFLAKRSQVFVSAVSGNRGFSTITFGFPASVNAGTMGYTRNGLFVARFDRQGSSLWLELWLCRQHRTGEISCKSVRSSGPCISRCLLAPAAL